MGVTEYLANGLQVVKEVHPTFLYESLWNLIGLILLILVVKKGRKFDGQIFLSYLAWYGIGRGLIEGLRTDSLYFFSTGLRVSQVLGFVSGLVGLTLLIYHLKFRTHTPDELWVNRLAADHTNNATNEEIDHDTMP